MAERQTLEPSRHGPHVNLRTGLWLCSLAHANVGGPVDLSWTEKPRFAPRRAPFLVVHPVQKDANVWKCYGENKKHYRHAPQHDTRKGYVQCAQ